jgi:EmrB/QacA subfamily drug resistance transporter
MTSSSDVSDALARPDGRTLAVYFSVLIAMFMAALDMNIVATALPTIAGELGGLDLFGWVGAAYLLTTAAVSPFYGKLGDMYGRKPVLIAAIVMFLAGSLACGMVPSMPWLVAARVVQGLGGGGLMVSVFAIIGDLFSPRQRARYQGYSTAVFTLASILGPVAGGYITASIGWRWIFLVNLPIGIIVLGLLAVVMKSTFNGKHHHVDYAGGVLLAIATTAIVYWSDHILDSTGPTVWTFVLPVMTVLAGLLFVIVERRAPEPIIPLKLFANRTMSLVVAISVLGGVATLGLFFYFALYLQAITGLSPESVGFIFMPSSVTSLIGSMLAGSIIARTGRYKLFPILGMALGALTMLSFLTITPTSPIWVLAVLMALFGLSLGLTIQVMIIAAQNAAPREDIGAATGLITLARTVGASLGLALNGAVMTAALNLQQLKLPQDVADKLPAGGLPVASPHELATLPAAIRTVALSAYNAGFLTLFTFVAGVFVLATLLSLLLPNVQLPRQAKVPTQRPTRPSDADAELVPTVSAE